MKWVHNYFKPETKHRLCNDYQISIVDRHASHISTKFIEFMHKYKIVCLYLPAHSPHLLQPFDIDVSGSLRQNYKMLLSKKTWLIIYNIDKANFISLIQKN